MIYITATINPNAMDDSITTGQEQNGPRSGDNILIQHEPPAMAVMAPATSMNIGKDP